MSEFSNFQIYTAPPYIGFLRNWRSARQAEKRRERALEAEMSEALIDPTFLDRALKGGRK